MQIANNVVLTGGVVGVNLDEKLLSDRLAIGEICRLAVCGSLTGTLGSVKDGSFSAVPRVMDIPGSGTAWGVHRVHPVESWECRLTGSIVNVTAESAAWLLPGGNFSHFPGFDVAQAGMTAASPENVWWIGETAFGMMIIILRNPVSTGGWQLNEKGIVGQVDFEFTSFSMGSESPFTLYILEEEK